MTRRTPRVVLVLCLLSTLSNLPSLAQTATQGATPYDADKTAFKSPMVLETVFAAADRSLWDITKGHLPGAFFSVDEYMQIGRYNCEGVYLRHKYDKATKTWQPGLDMSAAETPDGKLNIQVRVHVDNPKKNHDRKIEALFEVLIGGKVVASSTVKRAIEEGDEKPMVAPLTLPPSDLVQDPMMKLRITLAVALD